MKRFIKSLWSTSLSNRIALVLGCILLIISAVLLIQMSRMEKQLDILYEKERVLTEEIEKYE